MILKELSMDVDVDMDATRIPARMQGTNRVRRSSILRLVEYWLVKLLSTTLDT